MAFDVWLEMIYSLCLGSHHSSTSRLPISVNLKFLPQNCQWPAMVFALSCVKCNFYNFDSLKYYVNNVCHPIGLNWLINVSGHVLLRVSWQFSALNMLSTSHLPENANVQFCLISLNTIKIEIFPSYRDSHFSIQPIITARLR